MSTLTRNLHASIKEADRFAGSPKGLLEKTGDEMRKKNVDFPGCLEKK
jgi:hypothetical protein